MNFEYTNKYTKILIIVLGICLIKCDSKIEPTPNNFLLSIGSKSFDEAYSIAIDSDENIYLSGVFSKKIKLENKTTTELISKGGLDFFIAKFSKYGSFIWAKSFGGKQNDEIANMCIDQDNNIYTTGYYNSSIEIFPNNTSNNNIAFLLKMNSDGEIIWSKNINCSKNSEGVGVYIKNNAIYWTSFFSGTVSDSITCKGLTDILCSKLNYDGKTIIEKQFGNKGNDFPKDIYISDNNKLYLTTVFSKNANELISTSTLIELDKNLVQLSIAYLNNNVQSEAISIIVDKEDNKYITGSYKVNENNQDAFICKLNKNNVEVWRNTYRSSKNEWAKGLSFDLNGNIISAVVLNSNATISNGNKQLEGLGEYDIYISKLDVNGKILKYRIFGDSQEEGINKMILDTNNNLIFCGWFYKNLTINNKTKTSNGEGDVFLCKEKLNELIP